GARPVTETNRPLDSRVTARAAVSAESSSNTADHSPRFVTVTGPAMDCMLPFSPTATVSRPRWPLTVSADRVRWMVTASAPVPVLRTTARVPEPFWGVSAISQALPAGPADSVTDCSRDGLNVMADGARPVTPSAATTTLRAPASALPSTVSAVKPLVGGTVLMLALGTQP